MSRRAHKLRRLKTKSGLDYYSLYLYLRRVSRDSNIIFFVVPTAGKNGSRRRSRALPDLKSGFNHYIFVVPTTLGEPAIRVPGPLPLNHPLLQGDGDSEYRMLQIICKKKEQKHGERGPGFQLFVIFV